MKGYCPRCKEMCDYRIEEKEEVYPVKGEKIKVDARVAVCESCGIVIFNKELDSQNLNIAYSKYRKNHNLLFPENISQIREKYNLSQRALSRLLEWGEITMNRYETGAIQDPAHNEVLLFISEPLNMKKIFERNSYLLTEREREKLEQKIEQLMQGEVKHQYQVLLENFLSKQKKPDEYSGFINFSLEKMINLILYIANTTKGIFATKLNKLLWYIDFLNFKEYTVSVTGSNYVHHKYGPVPANYGWIIAAASSEGLQEEEVIYKSGKGGTRYTSTARVEDSCFTDHEKRVITFAIKYFDQFNCGQIKDKSHEEKGYKETKVGELISYKYAPDLSVDLED